MLDTLEKIKNLSACVVENITRGETRQAAQLAIQISGLAGDALEKERARQAQFPQNQKGDQQ